MQDHDRFNPETPNGIADPFTMNAVLCGEDGIVTKGAMWKGFDYPCTGHAHFAGEHIRCVSTAHDREG